MTRRSRWSGLGAVLGLLLVLSAAGAVSLAAGLLVTSGFCGLF